MTEPEYFRALRRVSVNMEVVVEGYGEDPKALVERAAERKKFSDRVAHKRDEHLRYSEIWCIVDVDDHIRLPDARQQARDNGIELAVSNPCFELWALLHFQSQTAYLERGKVRSQLKIHLPDYDKELPFDRLRPGYEEAVRRAEGLDRICERNGCPGDNPSTGVYRLTERILEEGKEAYLRQIREERRRRR